MSGELGLEPRPRASALNQDAILEHRRGNSCTEGPWGPKPSLTVTATHTLLLEAEGAPQKPAAGEVYESVSMSRCLQASVLLHDLSDQCVSVCCVCLYVSVSVSSHWVSVGVAVL